MRLIISAFLFVHISCFAGLSLGQVGFDEKASKHINSSLSTVYYILPTIFKTDLNEELLVKPGFWLKEKIESCEQFSQIDFIKYSSNYKNFYLDKKALPYIESCKEELVLKSLNYNLIRSLAHYYYSSFQKNLEKNISWIFNKRPQSLSSEYSTKDLFINSFLSFIADKDFKCSSPAHYNSFRKAFYADPSAEIKCSRRTFSQHQYPFEKRSFKRSDIKEIKIGLVDNEPHFKLNFCPDEIAKKAAKKYLCTLPKYEMILSFKGAVEDLAFNGKAVYPMHLFVHDSFHFEKEKREIDLKDIVYYDLKFNNVEKANFLDYAYQFVYHQDGNIKEISKNAIQETDYFLGQIIRDLKPNKTQSFITQLLASSKVGNRRVIKAKKRGLEEAYSLIKDKLKRGMVNLPETLDEYIELPVSKHLDFYHDWIQNSRDFANEAHYHSLKRRHNQKSIISAFALLERYSLKRKFYNRREALSQFLLDLKDKKLLTEEVSPLIFADVQTFKVSNYLSIRDSRQPQVERFLKTIDLTKSPKLLSKRDDLIRTGNELVEIESSVLVKFEEELANSVYLFKKSLHAYLDFILNKYFDADFGKLKSTLVNDRALKNFRTDLKIKFLGQKDLSDTSLRYFIKKVVDRFYNNTEFEDKY